MELSGIILWTILTALFAGTLYLNYWKHKTERAYQKEQEKIKKELADHKIEYLEELLAITEDANLERSPQKIKELIEMLQKTPRLADDGSFLFQVGMTILFTVLELGEKDGNNPLSNLNVN